jgi:hypothetical protein
MRDIRAEVTLDIETIPAQDETMRAELLAENIRAAEVRSAEIEEEIKAIRPPANIKDPEKIATWNIVERPKKEKKLRDEQITLDHNARAKAEEAWRKTSFDGALGHVAVIGFAINDDEPTLLWSNDYLKDIATWERAMLKEFFRRMDQLCMTGSVQRLPMFIGHRVRDFDLRFLYQRAVILDVKPSRFVPFDVPPFSDQIFDTMHRWTGGRDAVALDKLCKVLGIETKGTEIGEEIDGSQVWDFIRDGRIADVATYCGGDVKRARELYRRMTFWQPQQLEAAA